MPWVRRSFWFPLLLIGLAACSGAELSSSGNEGGSSQTNTGGFTSTSTQSSSGGGDGGDTAGGGGNTGGGNTGGGTACVPDGFAPKAESYPVMIGGQQAWVHDGGFTSGYFHTFDAIQVPDASAEPRKIHLFLPRNYSETCERYPVVYVNDGETTFWPGGPGNKSWDVAQGLEKLYQEGAIPPVIVVAIHALDRSYEYSHTAWAPDVRCCGVVAYADYVGDAIKGFVDTHFRTQPEPENTAIVGSSRGGLAAFLLANLRPDRFRKAVCMSPPFWVGIEPVFGGTFPDVALADSELLAMTGPTLSDPTQRPRLWIDWGLIYTGGFHNEVIEAASAEYSKQMVALLQESYDYKVNDSLFWAEDPKGEHDEVSWARRFPDAMKAIFSKP